MKKMSWLLLVPVVAFAVLLLLGRSLPREHVVSVRAAFRAPRESLHALVRDPSRATTWRSDLKDVVVAGGRWTETGRHGAITYEAVEDVPPSRWVTRIAQDDLGWGGTWTWSFEPDPGGGTIVTITERGFVEGAVMRVLAKLFFDPSKTAAGVLGDLGRHLGEEVTPETITVPNAPADRAGRG